MSNNLCKKCFFYGEPLCSYQYNTNRDVDICKYFKEIPQTVFERITVSPEVLAPFLVFHNRIYKGRTKYHSAVVGGEFDSYEEAIAATVARLKEVENG